MAETGCLRNASYSHISVQGNTNSINRIDVTVINIFLRIYFK